MTTANDGQKTVSDLIKERRPHRAVHIDALEWKKIRWPGEWGKVAFHPRPEDPSEPLFGITKFDPGGSFPDHAHGFAQIWYVLDGECTLDGETYRPGTFVYHPDPHVEREMKTDKGVTILFCQYPGPNTGERPVYGDRFDLERERRDISEEPTTY
ncbi:MAG: cupin domain-containing protein [Betaproteobacteria bacterium]|nr:cupin domain-containing protein [Betaproteobacteria bacterium]